MTAVSVLRPLFAFTMFLLAPTAARAADWTDWRGPNRDGTSPERNLPTQWSPSGENLAWKAPYGGRSTPIVMDGRLYMLNAKGQGATLQERVLCLNADTGKLIWEYSYNVYLSDVPPHRIAWSSPVGDPATGNVYAYGVGGTLLSLSRDGKVLWERSLGEDFGLVTTHGGRTVSPVIEGDLVIVSGINSGWGDQARGAHRFMAFDKKTGQTVWVSSPGGRPFDTTYSTPIAAEVNGTRLILAGSGDGAVHAMKALTGEPVWKYEISKRGINTGVVLYNATAYVSHSEENFDSNTMGLLAAVDANAKGTIGKEQIKWKLEGFQGGFSSPVLDGDRLYQIDNGSNLYAFDAVSGKQLWTQNLGTIQKASPVLADGRLYVGNENGKFFILKPRNDGCDIVDEDRLGTEEAPEIITASPAISDGRIFLVTSEAVYSIGKKSAAGAGAVAPKLTPASKGPVAHVQVVPTELVLKPGEAVQLHARLFDDQGHFIREGKASWSLEKLGGSMESGGRYVAPKGSAAQAGLVKATVDGVAGAARVRVIPPLPWEIDFDSLNPGPPPVHWINATGKYQVRDVEGGKILVKLADNPFTKRARTFLGPSDWHDYTVQADVRATEKRRQMGDAGVVAQRYALILFGNHQRLELQSWQPETERTIAKPFPWKADAWYRLKLRVENVPGGKARVQGKAWPAGEPEPSGWTIETVDAVANREGSPGIYADAAFEVFFDNLKVTANQ